MAIMDTLFPEFQRLLIVSCVRNKVCFQWSPGVLMIMRRGIESVVGDLPANALIAGFDSFTLIGYTVVPRLDNMATYQPPLPPALVLPDLKDLEDDLDLWIEIVGSLQGETSAP